jgi:hypothetical protein
MPALLELSSQRMFFKVRGVEDPNCSHIRLETLADTQNNTTNDLITASNFLLTTLIQQTNNNNMVRMIENMEAYTALVELSKEKLVVVDFFAVW